MYFAGEDERHFHVAHPAGHAVSMAKAGLTPEMHAQIRALPKLPVKLAGGNEVPTFDENGVPQIDPGSGFARRAEDQAIATDRNAQADAVAALPDATAAGLKAFIAPEKAPPSQLTGYSYTPPDAAPAAASAPTVEAPAAAASEAAAPAPAAAPPKPAGGESAGPILDAAKKEQAAIRSKAEAEYTAATSLADLHDQQAKELLDHDRETQQIVAADRARQDAIFKDIASAKVDPNHYWQDKSTGQKLLAGIGMIFSGLGSGLAGGPNLAHQVIERAIDRDIDAQKANIGKKQNLLSYYQRQTGDDLAARQLTKATMLNAFAGQVASQAARASAGTVRQSGEMAAQQARINAFDLSQQAIARSQGIKQNEIGLRQALEAETVRHQLYGDGTQGARPVSAQLLQHAASLPGTGVTPEQIVTIDRQGGQARAKSDASAKIVNEKLPEIHSSQDLLDRLQQLHENPASVLAPGSDAGDEYNKLRRELAVKTEKALAGRVSDQTVEQQIGAIGSGWNQFIHNRDPLAAIRTTLEGEKQALLNQHVWGYKSPAQVREQPAATGTAQPPAAGAVHVTNGRQGAWLLPGKPLPAGWKAG